MSEGTWGGAAEPSPEKPWWADPVGVRPLWRWAWFALVGIALSVAAQLLATFDDLALWFRLEGTDVVSNAEFVALLDRSVMLLRMNAAVFAVAGVAFMGWLYRARSNVAAFGVMGLTYDKGWAIGGWLIPFANFVIPGRIVAQVYRASDPVQRPGQLGAFGGRSAAPVWCWWAAFAGLMAVHQLRFFVDINTNLAYTDEAYVSGRGQLAGLSVIAAVLAIVAALLVVQIVVQLTRDQHRWLNDGS